MLRVESTDPAHALLRPKGQKFAYCCMNGMHVHPQNEVAHIRLVHILLLLRFSRSELSDTCCKIRESADGII